MEMAKLQIHEESRTLYLARALYDAVDDCNIQQVNMLLCQNKANPNVLIIEEVGNSHNKEYCRIVHSKSMEKENSLSKEGPEKCTSVDTIFNKSDKLHTSSGYFNSGESYDTNSVRSIKYDSDYQKNDNYSESILSDTANSISDILNANISPDIHCEDFPSRICFDGSIISSITDIRSVNNDDEDDLKNIFSKTVLSETSKLKEIELSTENSICSNDNEWMTEISGLSSLFNSEEYFTCPDTNTEKSIIDNISNKNGVKNNEIIPFNKIFDINHLEVSNYQSSSSDSGSLTDLTDDYDTDYLRQNLRRYGYHPGPLLPSTKQVYVRRLNRILKTQSEFQHDKPINKLDGFYSRQLTQILTIDESDTWIKTIKSWSILEKDIIYHKSGPSFTYLLLDPRITRNLPARADQINNPIVIWRAFISSIFYVGKGTNFRPKDHMNEAFKSWIEKVDKGISPKSEYILSLWKENLGVVCVQAFHHLVLKEAHIREAAMIDALGLNKLTNEKRGTYYDNTTQWRNTKRCELGCYLLYRAMLVFLADGERQLQPIDLT
ncbi:Hypothetical protein CINCED_3A012722 [Cinara cedri]|uniref:LEM domain-containing protein n=1 Tax=Cinara cedri TaxID=506608 RepID=A0A5E4MQ52_9HEMI|nr:Hypothetical protein CINCED_3A012722 [Cinara cedri]